jgi:hypothetical protein
MKQSLPLFSMILAVGLAAVGAHAQIPGFVREGLVVTYQGSVNILPDYPPAQQASSQEITINTVTSNPVIGTTVIGTTVVKLTSPAPLVILCSRVILRYIGPVLKTRRAY